jgi:hypothetical protein
MSFQSKAVMKFMFICQSFLRETKFSVSEPEKTENDSVESSCSLEADNRSAGQEIPRLYGTPISLPLSYLS